MTRELPASLRLAGFIGVLVLAFGAAYGVGSATGPVDVPSAPAGSHSAPSSDADVHQSSHTPDGSSS